MKSSPFDSLNVVTARLGLALLLAGASAHAQSAPPPPAATSQPAADSVALPSPRAREPLAEPETVKVRLDGEYELRQSFLTALPLTAYAGGPAHLEQTSRLFHWLRVRPLALFGEHWELRGEVDLPRGMVYGVVPEGIPDSGTDFDEQQPVQFHARVLRLTARNSVGEVTLGHTTTSHGMGLVDDDGDAPRWFGTPDRPSTFERVQLTSGTPSSTLRVGLSGDLAFQDERLALTDDDRKWRVGLTARYAPSRRAHLSVLARYEALQAKGELGGARSFLFDASGGFRSPLPGRSGELFGAYEAAYRVGDVSEPVALAESQEVAVKELAFATRVGFALERIEDDRRYAHVVVSLEWGMASGDADVKDDEQHRFVMNPNHGVGLLLFSELLRFKTSRAQALLEASNPAAANARSWGLATRGGVAGASYLNPVVVVRPTPDLSLKAGAVVASSTTDVVDPSALSALFARGERQNYDGGPVSGRSLGSELDVGAELKIPLDPPMELRLSVEAGVAFPGSAFDDASGNGLGTQALTTAGLGLTF
jgi:hypothetical protein